MNNKESLSGYTKCHNNRKMNCETSFGLSESIEHVQIQTTSPLELDFHSSVEPVREMSKENQNFTSIVIGNL